MHCLNHLCDANEIEKDDNFCYKCGTPTSNGYSNLNKQELSKEILQGEFIKQNNRLAFCLILLTTLFMFIIIIGFFRGNEIFKPFFYLKRQINNYMYGYYTTTIKTDNIYEKQNIFSYEDAINFIKKDLNNQQWKCKYNFDILEIQTRLENDYSISSVNFCDMSLDEVNKISKVIDKMYSLFSNIQGGLTNITISNAKSNSEYIAYFQPMFQFVNPSSSADNKVNKTQILLNSYYFLNNKIMEKTTTEVIGEDLYVKDATFESTIAHEFGHYISFILLLKENNLENIVFETKENTDKIRKILNYYDTGTFTKEIVIEALHNYNEKYSTNYDLEKFSLSISKYANIKIDDGNYNFSEIIAEAIHDYYLHYDKCSLSSMEIVKIIKTRLDNL